MQVTPSAVSEGNSNAKMDTVCSHTTRRVPLILFFRSTEWHRSCISLPQPLRSEEQKWIINLNLSVARCAFVWIFGCLFVDLFGLDIYLFGPDWTTFRDNSMVGVFTRYAKDHRLIPGCLGRISDVYVSMSPFGQTNLKRPLTFT